LICRGFFVIIRKMKPHLVLVLLAAAACPQAHADSAFLDQVKEHFAAWDADHDGVLSIPEVEHGVAAPGFKGPAAAAIATLRRAARMKGGRAPVLTLENIQNLVPWSTERKELPNLEAMYDSALKKIRASTPQLLEVSRLHLENLEQGRLGDCFCLAPLGTLLHSRPAEVVKMFSISANGSAIVRLGGGRSVEVPFPTDAERALMAGTDGSGVWANCYEKAVGQLRMRRNDPEYPTALSVVTRGGSAGTMLSVLTGHEIERISCALFRDKAASEKAKQELLAEIRRQLSSTQAAGRLICGGTASGQTAEGRRPSGVHGPHAYAVLHYEAETDVVMLWDPHGDDFKPAAEPPGLANGYARTQGRMQVPLAELVQWFGGFSFETDRPLKD
jgi:Calpain family cysteine protease